MGSYRSPPLPALLLAPLLLAPLLLLLSSTGVSAVLRRTPPPPDAMTCNRWNPPGNCRNIGNNTRRVSLNALGGSGMEARKHYLNGIFSLDIKLPAGNTTGVVYAWYLMDSISKTNKDPNHSEIDIEIFGGGNATSAMLATNIFCNGKQNLAQYKLPFDPSAAFHTYSVQWNARQIVWFVDGQPIRILNRRVGEPWPMYAMRPTASIWLAGWVQNRINPTFTPVSVQFANYTARGCSVTAYDVQKPRAQCAGPWNWGLTPPQFAAWRQNRAQLMLADYGWDNV